MTEPTRGPGRVVAHHHVWDLSVRDQPWTAGLAPLRRSFTVDDLRPAAQRADVTATVVVQTITVAEETPELLALAAAELLIAGVVGWVPLDSPEVADRLAALRSLPGGDPLVGVRHLVPGEPDSWWLARPEVRAGLAAVGASGLAYDGSGSSGDGQRCDPGPGRGAHCRRGGGWRGGTRGRHRAGGRAGGARARFPVLPAPRR